jgi:multiple sugar transport system permease protein
MTVQLDAAGRRARSRRYAALRHSGTGALLVLPAAVLVLFLFVVPLAILVYMSFQDWPLLGTPSPNGIDNYRKVAGNELFVGAIGFTLLYTALTTILIFGISFILVSVAASARRGARIYRTIFFLPFVVGTASAALIWYAAINDQTGIVNAILQGVGLTNGPWGFLSTPDKALFTILTLVVWKFIGFQVVVLVVALQTIPRDLYEAARLDGAKVRQQIRYITLPLLRPTLALLLIISITGSLLAFDQFYVLTRGGPDNSTITLVYAIYDTAFTSFRLGRAAAMAVVLLLALVVLNLVQLTVLRRRDDA